MLQSTLESRIWHVWTGKQWGENTVFTWLLFRFPCPVLCWDKPIVWAAESFHFEIIKQLPRMTPMLLGWIWVVAPSCWLLAAHSQLPVCAGNLPPELPVLLTPRAHLQEQLSLLSPLLAAGLSGQQVLPRLASLLFCSGRKVEGKARWLPAG